MKQSKRQAFILADSLLALTIISLGITFTLICHQCLMQRARQQQVNLAAWRIAKEATDELAVTQQSVHARRSKFNAIASRKRVIVYYGNQMVLEVAR